MNAIKAPQSIVQSASIDGAVYLTRALERFLRNPGPGDPTFFDAVVLPSGRIETVGCVGESYEDRLYDGIWMARRAILGLVETGARRAIYRVRLNGQIEWLSVAPYGDGIILDHCSAPSSRAA